MSLDLRPQDGASLSSRLLTWASDVNAAIQRPEFFNSETREPTGRESGIVANEDGTAKFRACSESMLLGLTRAFFSCVDNHNHQPRRNPSKQGVKAPSKLKPQASSRGNT